MTYIEKLKHPKWQQMRLRIMERDRFTCKICGSSEKTLTVHHLFYINKRDPWDYPWRALITVCNDCHNRIHLDYTVTKTMTEYEIEKLFNEYCRVYDYSVYSMEQFYKYNHTSKTGVYDD